MDFKKLIKLRIENNAFAHAMGLEILEIREGYARSRLTVRPDHLNPIGSVHGGCLYTLADTTCGAAASSYGYQITTMDGHLHYLRPGLNTSVLYSEAKVLKHGKRISVYEISITDQDNNLLSYGTFSFASLGKKIITD